MSTLSNSIEEHQKYANSTGNMVIMEVTTGSLITNIKIYPNNVKEGDTIECNECEATCVVGEDHTCPTCDRCGDMMTMSTCLGYAECCGEYENICNNCGIWDNDKDEVVCEECHEDTDDDEPKMTLNDYLWSKDARNNHDGTPMPVNYPHM
jgi:hypothetical protein